MVYVLGTSVLIVKGKKLLGYAIAGLTLLVVHPNLGESTYQLPELEQAVSKKLVLHWHQT